MLRGRRPYIASMQLPFAIRDVGQRLFRGVPIRVASGLNQGMRWSIVSTGRGYGSGTFGVRRLDVLRHVVRPGDTVWDVGAHKGFMTLALAQLVGPTGRVVSFEPSARNRWFIERHLTWNAITNATLLPVAIGSERGDAEFGGRGDSLAYQLGHGDETVPVRRIPDVIDEFGVPTPDVLKIDAEGQEAGMLRTAGDALPDHAALLISVHGRDMHAECTEALAHRGFTLLESWDMALCSRDPDRAWTSDHDLLAIGPTRDVDLAAISALPLFSGHD